MLIGALLATMACAPQLATAAGHAQSKRTSKVRAAKAKKDSARSRQRSERRDGAENRKAAERSSSDQREIERQVMEQVEPAELPAASDRPDSDDSISLIPPSP